MKKPDDVAGTMRFWANQLSRKQYAYPAGFDMIFGCGNAGVRMSDAEIEMYLLRARLSLPDENGRYQVPRE
ncbi:hypothetical protein, partial [Acetobacter pomorum]|uniref:hypothetical protein n=1 Tax=Acetobacter pomorum TaxID=65959 RepID=UPI001EE8240D